MDAKTVAKPKRRKKNRSRTQVSSDSDSDSDVAKSQKISRVEKSESKASKTLSDEEVHAQFTKFYLQKATQEFANDLNLIRTAEDFRDDAFPLLMKALQQGTEVFSKEEQRRIVLAGLREDEKSNGNAS